MDELDESRPAPRPKPSKIPSWIMLGFLLGAIFVWALPRPREPAPLPEPTVARPVIPILAHPRLTDVEAFFAVWGKYAVWADNTTYVCMWSVETKSFLDCYEVWRRGDDFFFRSTSRPANLVPLNGIPSESPLQFLNPVPEVRGYFGERLTPPPVEAPSMPAAVKD